MTSQSSFNNAKTRQCAVAVALKQGIRHSEHHKLILKFTLKNVPKKTILKLKAKLHK